MSLRRVVTRSSELLSLRKTSQRDQARLGSYPVPPEAYIWWCNRFQVPGGEIKQTFSHLQQKIMWQWFWNAPGRWYWRLSAWAWPVGVPALLMYIFVYKSCECDVEQSIKAKRGGEARKKHFASRAEDLNITQMD
eukprot:CAMPEP_0181427948 /NCGR_PEP_ID=MMETSP1110-20121109/16428_1 /TAXON_ID=174948 /ORGANISM="Symbiodinium sp., Strain CCMP421" /LENGTH=134 /DNA_ID=CAMNT_0023551163 /DNA_START=65 /DNA_END=467 /DNA_ORIENTATION=+